MSLQIFTIWSEDKKTNIDVAVSSEDAEKFSETIRKLCAYQYVLNAMINKSTPEEKEEFKKLIVEADAALKKARDGE